MDGCFRSTHEYRVTVIYDFKWTLFFFMSLCDIGRHDTTTARHSVQLQSWDRSETQPEPSPPRQHVLLPHHDTQPGQFTFKRLDPLLDSVRRPDHLLQDTSGADPWTCVSFAFIGPLHWFPVATDRIVELIPRLDRGLNTLFLSSPHWFQSPQFTFNIPSCFMIHDLNCSLCTFHSDSAWLTISSGHF